MTGIILRGLESGSFSLWKFYMARVRRIVPALIVLLLILLVLGWFWLPSHEYRSLGTQAAYALTFISNIHFWQSAGYFDTAAHEKWLLHTWSLGIEMQFYLLYPVFVTLVWKIRPGVKAFASSLIILFTLSLLLSVFVSSWKPSAAFYLLLTRGWELAAGGLVYLAGRNLSLGERQSKFLYMVGIVLGLVGFVFIDSTYSWPSAWALLPVGGTALILFAHRDGALLMVNPLARWLGEISYSLYLWHWPLVVVLYFAGLQGHWGWVAVALLLSLLLGQMSLSLVENPFRRILTRVGVRKQVMAFGLAGLLIGGLAVGVRMVTFENRMDAAVEIAAAEVENRDPRHQECFEPASEHGSPGCIYGKNKVGAVFVGDSHAASMVTAMGVAAENQGTGSLFYGMTSCPTMDGIMHATQSKPWVCKKFNEWVFAEIDKHPDVPMVLVNRTSAYLWGGNEPDRKAEVQGITVHFGKPYNSRFDSGYVEEFKSALTATACRAAKSRPVFLMRPIPEFKTSVYRSLVQNHFKGVPGDIRMPLAEYHERNKHVWEAQDEAAAKCGVRILDPLPYFCDGEYCYASHKGRPFYYDDDHLSEYGNKYLVPMFEQVFTARVSQTSDF